MSEKDGKARILEAATEVFASSGFHQASIRQVARMARVTNPAIYYHFRSKRGLYQAVHMAAYSHFKHQIELTLSGVAGLRARLVAFARTCIREVQENPRVGRLIFSTLLQSPRVQGPEHWFDTYLFEIKDLIVGWFKDGLTGTPNERRIPLAVIAYFSLVVGVIQHILLDQADVELTDETVEQLVDILLTGLNYQ